MLTKEDSIISAFLKSLGPWKNQIIIGGGYALIIYKLYLEGKMRGYPPVGTRDIDSLIPRRMRKMSTKDIADHLIEAGFKVSFKSRDNPPIESYVKEISEIEIEVEFLTDNAARFNKSKNVKIEGVVAQPLAYLKLSLENTVQFTTESGEAGLVVSPATWMFHKGLTFPARTSESKKYKDLYGIWYVGTQLPMLFDGIIEEFNQLAQQNHKWFQKFQNNLKGWIEDAAPKDWMKLEAQDPFGALKKPGFERFIQTIIA